MDSESLTVCVTGASGFIGSWLVMRLIQRGYTVRATVVDPDNMKKVKPLLEIPGAESKLSLWKANLAEEGSFDEAIKGCIGVFHVATPIDFESKDPENEVIKPAIRGVIDIMKACLKAKTVRRLVYTSSAITTHITDQPKALYDESCWTDVELCRREKMPGWMYFVSKTLAEQEAWKFAKENGMDFITILPTLVVGPFLPPSMPSSIITALSPILRREEHYGIIRQGKLVHIQDICLAHIFLFEEPKAEGRYICNARDVTIHEIAKIINNKYPEYNVPTEFEKNGDELEVVKLSSKKLTDLGFEFKYSVEDMYTEAIDTCREKGLLPKTAQTS
ncbi:dihydroflavonol 4-reductase-like [Vigna radiata var. radiata]|uniref:Dihydroflavonol 4-reductase-like n=1 Tax=Vigna radiata var. radiata TaxID=3916 RepID=A0A1S3V115_VIGRR|nr:dihydroflavonol 4-reductase-like [Vigna radiata var. radiata]